MNCSTHYTLDKASHKVKSSLQKVDERRVLLEMSCHRVQNDVSKCAAYSDRFQFMRDQLMQHTEQ